MMIQILWSSCFCCVLTNVHIMRQQSFVITAPQSLSRAGDSRANVPRFYLCIVPVGGGGGNARDIIFLGKYGSAM